MIVVAFAINQPKLAYGLSKQLPNSYNVKMLIYAVTVAVIAVHASSSA